MRLLHLLPEIIEVHAIAVAEGVEHGERCADGMAWRDRRVIRPVDQLFQRHQPYPYQPVAIEVHGLRMIPIADSGKNVNGTNWLIRLGRLVFMAAMARRSIPQAKVDEQTFPIRVRLVVPERGFGVALDEMHAWLREHVGRNYAWHGGDWGGDFWNRVQTSTLYFRFIGDAHQFFTAFPEVKLSDDTRLPD